MISNTISNANQKWAAISFSSECDCRCESCNKNRDEEKPSNDFRLCADEAITLAKEASNRGFKNILLEAGNDSQTDRDLVTYTIYSIKRIADVSIALSICNRPINDYRAWSLAGADILILNIFNEFINHYRDLNSKQEVEYFFPQLRTKNLSFAYELNLDRINESYYDSILEFVEHQSPQFLVCKSNNPKAITKSSVNEFINKLSELNPELKIAITDTNYTSYDIKNHSSKNIYFKNISKEKIQLEQPGINIHSIPHLKSQSATSSVKI